MKLLEAVESLPADGGIREIVSTVLHFYRQATSSTFFLIEIGDDRWSYFSPDQTSDPKGFISKEVFIEIVKDLILAYKVTKYGFMMEGWTSLSPEYELPSEDPARFTTFLFTAVTSDGRGQVSTTDPSDPENWQVTTEVGGYFSELLPTGPVLEEERRCAHTRLRNRNVSILTEN